MLVRSRSQIDVVVRVSRGPEEWLRPAPSYERWMRGRPGPAETGVFLARVALADAAR